MGGCQLSIIQVQWRPEWKIATYHRYECENDLCGQWLIWTITHVVYLHVGSIFRSGIYLCFFHLLRYEVYHPRASPSDKEWAVGWMQPDLLPCEVVSLIIGTGQGLLARWRKSTFGMSSGLMTKGWHQQVIITPGLWLDDWKSWQVTRDNWTWRGSRLERFWNNWGLGE